MKWEQEDKDPHFYQSWRRETVAVRGRRLFSMLIEKLQNSRPPLAPVIRIEDLRANRTKREERHWREGS